MRSRWKPRYFIGYGTRCRSTTVTFCHISSHFVTNRHGGAEPGIGGAEPGIRVGNSPAQNLLVFSNVLSKGYIQQQEGCKYPTEYSDS
jgi:hypothetical protein